MSSANLRPLASVFSSGKEDERSSTPAPWVSEAAHDKQAPQTANLGNAGIKQNERFSLRALPGAF